MAVENHGFDPNNNIYNLTSILDRIAALEAGTALNFDNIYPVGSIYITTNSTNPGTLFPGTTWERYGNGRVIAGVDENDGDFRNAGTTSGSKLQTVSYTGSVDGMRLLANQLPRHNHNVGSHYHKVLYESTMGASDLHIYGNYVKDPVGGNSVNVLIPEHSTSGDVENGKLQKRFVTYGPGHPDQQVSKPMKTDSPEGSVGTSNAYGGNNGNADQADVHAHTFRVNTVINHMQPAIACYIWRRKA